MPHAPERPQIVHVPHGIEDPYTPQPWERHPREPRDGDIVNLSIVTLPEGSAHNVSVQVHSSALGESEAQAGKVPREGDGDRWEVALGPFATGDEVYYHIEALLRRGERTTDGPHTFAVSTWHLLTSVTSWRWSPSVVVLELADRTGHQSLAAIDIVEVGVLRLRVWPVGAASVPQGEHQGIEAVHQEDQHLVIRATSLEAR